MKKTPLKNTQTTFKKTPLKASIKSLKGNFLLKKTKTLENKCSSLNKDTKLKKQNDKAKTKWEKIRDLVLKRDEYKCIVCGKPATQVHHIHLRSKRKDLMYEINNLVSLCDVHHFHKSNEKYEEQTLLIAKAKRMTLAELLKFAETKSEE